MKKAVDILCLCRQTLTYTYVFAYYLKKNNQSVIFEDNQKDLESTTERLSEYLERKITSENLADIKQKVQDKYRHVYNYSFIYLFIYSRAVYCRKLDKRFLNFRKINIISLIEINEFSSLLQLLPALVIVPPPRHSCSNGTPTTGSPRVSYSSLSIVPHAGSVKWRIILCFKFNCHYFCNDIILSQIS